ncbi:MAG: hypothetical protein ACLP52_11045 [Streptosporangiaceae bacterium]
MAETSQLPLPGRPGRRAPGARHGGSRRSVAGSLLATAAIVAGSALLGLAAGAAWQAVAPRALFIVVSRGAANVANPETTAFIAADGWFCILAAIGGVATGLLGYALAVRRYGPLPMAGVLAGGVAAAYTARWAGQRAGLTAFNSRLATARAGTLLHAPLTLGAHSALALWPLAAGLVAGGLETVVLLRERQQAAERQLAAAAQPPVAGYLAPPGYPPAGPPPGYPPGYGPAGSADGRYGPEADGRYGPGQQGPGGYGSGQYGPGGYGSGQYGPGGYPPGQYGPPSLWWPDPAPGQDGEGAG